MADGERAETLVSDNIDKVLQLEAATLKHRTPADRAADAIAAFVGSIPFVGFHIVWLLVWVIVNAGLVPSIPPFDPFPFSFLGMVVSLEGVLLATFVLIKQNRMGYISDRRAHLDLQVNLLTEREVTRLLQLTAKLAQHLNIPEAGSRAGALLEETEIEKLVGALDQRLSEES